MVPFTGAGHHKIVIAHHGEVDYEALQYMGSLEISDEDFTFLEGIAESQGIDFESDED
ncbi:MAG: hypothetical protein GY826_16390 [Fuerstiella sp.]|nr:hypothetical protein [Fuerstiella sp.]